eukprot:4505563-Prorocentrum_lima.AAC.1
MNSPQETGGTRICIRALQHTVRSRAGVRDSVRELCSTLMSGPQRNGGTRFSVRALQHAAA